MKQRYGDSRYRNGEKQLREKKREMDAAGRKKGGNNSCCVPVDCVMGSWQRKISSSNFEHRLLNCYFPHLPSIQVYTRV